jgi:hypothetical protein
VSSNLASSARFRERERDRGTKFRERERDRGTKFRERERDRGTKFKEYRSFRVQGSGFKLARGFGFRV